MWCRRQWYAVLSSVRHGVGEGCTWNVHGTSSMIGGGGDVTYLSLFREERHENSPYRGQI